MKDTKLQISLPQLDKKFIMESPGNLRSFLIKQAPGFLYARPMNLIHCRGLGTCGTCAVKIAGKVSPMTAIEKWRLGFPPHKKASGLRLACQCRPEGDLVVTKLSGLWGQG